MGGSYHDLHVYVWLALGPRPDVLAYLGDGITALLYGHDEIVTRALHSLATGRAAEAQIHGR